MAFFLLVRSTCHARARIVHFSSGVPYGLNVFLESDYEHTYEAASVYAALLRLLYVIAELCICRRIPGILFLSPRGSHYLISLVATSVSSVHTWDYIILYYAALTSKTQRFFNAIN